MPSFVEHLQQACSRIPDYAVFNQAYSSCLEGVHELGVFSLYGMTISAPPGVYSPHETSSTRFFMDRFPALKLDTPFGTKRFLEIGCGAGAISLHAARAGWDVLATDIDPVAVKAARGNAEYNELRLETSVSDLFSAIAPHQMFDVIVFNQPFFHVDRTTASSELALATEGAKLHARFLRDARERLLPGGHVVFTYANCSDIQQLQQPGWELELRSFDFDASSNYIRAGFIARPVA